MLISGLMGIVWWSCYDLVKRSMGMKYRMLDVGVGGWIGLIVHGCWCCFMVIGITLLGWG
ncbi:hypothetical protein [Candidatus Hodgkinia cicadicola]|uniref:hypothetical protein n=1 Tax=Candidatus Hodgkinia cicadicola TaxID=573658 RepID=UPI002414EF3A